MLTISSRTVVPELDNVIANLELLPLRLNESKNDIRLRMGFKALVQRASFQFGIWQFIFHELFYLYTVA